MRRVVAILDRCHHCAEADWNGGSTSAGVVQCKQRTNGVRAGTCRVEATNARHQGGAGWQTVDLRRALPGIAAARLNRGRTTLGPEAEAIDVLVGNGTPRRGDPLDDGVPANRDRKSVV